MNAGSDTNIGSPEPKQNPQTSFFGHCSSDEVREMFRSILEPVVLDLIQSQHKCRGCCCCANESSAQNAQQEGSSSHSLLDPLHGNESEPKSSSFRDSQEYEDRCTHIDTPDYTENLCSNAHLEDSCRS
jgi:hypothetical protein